MLKKVSVNLHHIHLQLWHGNISFKTGRVTGGIVKEIYFCKEIKKEAQRYYLKDGQSDHKKKNKKEMKRGKGGKNWALGAKKIKKLGILVACLVRFYKLCALNYYYRGGGAT